MPANVLVGHPWLHVAVAAGLLLPLQCPADPAARGRAGTGGFSVMITIQPQFPTLASKPVEGGHE